MNKISQQDTEKTSVEWKEKFLDVRKVKIVKFINKKRLDASGLLDRIKTDGKICDAGCGDLSLLGQLKTLGYKNLYGFDIDEELINSSSKNSLSENEFSVIKVGSVCQFPFDDESFNAVIIWGILHHIDPKDYKIVFSEAARVLKPKGEIFIVDDLTQPEPKTSAFHIFLTSLNILDKKVLVLPENMEKNIDVQRK